ncbi:MAG: hypothetical protein ACXWC9_07995 [Pseudobdellovibrionaceae bacterium]
MHSTKMFISFGAATILLLSSSACEPKKIDDQVAEEPSAQEPEVPEVPPNYLYVSSGLCLAGAGVTTFSATTASNLVYRINLENGERDSIIADFNAAPASGGDTPVGLVNWDDNNLAVLIGNGATGRIELTPKNGNARSNFGLTPGPATIFSAIPRFFGKTNEGGFFTIRSAAIDKISSTGIRQAGPAASVTYVTNALGATCGNTNTTYSFALHTSATSNRIIAGHSFAGTNRLISLPAVGANSATQCVAAQAAPGAGTAWPLAAVYDSANAKLIVAWGNSATTANTNMIVAYDYNETTGAFGTANTIYDISTGTFPYTLFNVSAMTLDAATNSLYVSTAVSTATTVLNYAIEKFTYDPTKIGVANTAVLTRVGTVPFYNYGVDTKCISGMTISN